MRTTITTIWVAILMITGGCLSGCDAGVESGAIVLAGAESSGTSVTAEATDASDLLTDASSGSSVGESPEYTSLFEKDSVIDVHIDLDENDWAAILEDATAEDYYSAEVTVNGISVSNVGIRAKGNSSLMSVAQSDSDRYSLRIKFDEYADDQTLLGLDEFVLNNCFNDPSYMREYLTYEAFSLLGANTPLTTYANIYINGELFGFYLCVETVDDSFLDREFGNNDGNLYKAGEGSTLQSDSSVDTFSLENGDDEKLSKIQDIESVLAAMPESEKGEIESVLDVESALKYLAVNTVLGSYDSYLGDKSQNFYLYERDGLLTVIPWDYNMSFGGYPEDGGRSTTIPIDEPVLGVTMDSRPLVSKLLAVDEYLQKYHAYIETLTTYLGEIAGRTAALAEIISPFVEADPNSFYTYAEFEDAIILHTDNETTNNDMGTAETTPLAPASGSSSSGDTDVPELPESGIDPGSRIDPESNSCDELPPELPEGAFNPGSDTAGPPGGNTISTNPGSYMPGGQAGGGMPIAEIPVSILDYAADRTLNLMLQLSGDLETTGNTTMDDGAFHKDIQKEAEDSESE